MSIRYVKIRLYDGNDDHKIILEAINELPKDARGNPMGITHLILVPLLESLKRRSSRESGQQLNGNSPVEGESAVHLQSDKGEDPLDHVTNMTF